MDRDDRFLAPLGNNADFDAARLNIKDSIRRVALTENRLARLERQLTTLKVS